MTQAPQTQLVGTLLMDGRLQLLNCIEHETSFWDELAAWDIASDEALMMIEDLLADTSITDRDLRFRMSMEYSLEKYKDLWARLADI